MSSNVIAEKKSKRQLHSTAEARHALVFSFHPQGLNMNKLIIAGLTAEEICNMLDDDHWAFRLLAQTVCSTYWGGFVVDLHEFGRLSQENWTLATAIIGYRRQKGWHDDSFHQLALWCKERHGLEKSAGPSFC